MIKRFSLLITILLFTGVLLAACIDQQPAEDVNQEAAEGAGAETGGESTEGAYPGAADTAVEETEETAVPEGAEVKTLYVGPNTAECEGEGPQTCLLVKENPEDDYQFFYSNIDGFEYEEGFEYNIRVLVEPVENPPAGGSSLNYTLIEVVDKQKVAADEEDILWKVISYQNAAGELVDVLPETEITATFQSGKVAGNAGCNQYFASYEVNGNNITVEPTIGSTMMFCAPEEVMQQETDYLATLGSAASFEIVNGQLHVSNADGALILVYETVEAAPLTNSLWQALNYNNGKEAVVSTIIDTEITAVFGDDGNLSGAAGCNQYNAPYTTEGNRITIGPAATTRMFCGEPEGIMEQEAAYLAALETAATYTISGDELELLDANGARVATYISQGNADGAGEGGTETTIPAEGEVQTWYVGPQTVDCVGVAPQKCLLVKQNPEDEYQLFYNSIEGFEYEEGYQYELLVLVEPVENPPADASSLKYTLVEQVNKQAAAPADDAAAETSQPAESLAPDAVKIDLQGLASYYQWLIVPASPYDESQPPGPKGAPKHLFLVFDGENPFQTRRGLRIYPVEQYKQLWESNGNPTITNVVDQLQTLLTERPELNAPLPVLPPQAGLNDLAVQADYLDFGNVNGIRFVGRFAQDANPVTADQLLYYYQGLTSDGQYYVSFMHQITTDQLPQSAEDVSAETMQKFEQDFNAYIQETAVMLNGLSPDDWSPSLTSLDNMITSLEIETPGGSSSGETPPAAPTETAPEATPEPTTTPEASAPGLTGTVWKWQQMTTPVEQVTVDNSANYTVEFKEDGTVAIKADCNNASGSYTTTGNSISIPPMATTLAICPEGSLSDLFLSSLMGAASYYFDGPNLFLDLKFDSGTMQFAP